MPLTKTGKGVMKSMMEQYGAKKGKQVFYASINAKKTGSSKWHRKSKSNYSNSAVNYAIKKMM